jgi:hypothetical protein
LTTNRLQFEGKKNKFAPLEYAANSCTFRICCKFMDSSNEF